MYNLLKGSGRVNWLRSPIAALTTIFLGYMIAPQAVADRVDSTKFYHGRAVERANSGELGLASEDLFHAVRLSPDDPQLRFNLGIVLVKINRLDDAREQFRLAAENDPPHAGALHNLGLLARLDGQRNEAEGLFLKAIEMDSIYVDPMLQLGAVMAVQDRYDDALGWFTHAANLYPQAALPRRLLALAQTRRDEYQSGMSAGHMRVRHIMTSTRDEAQKVHRQLLAGGDFISLALKHSKDPSAELGGDMGFFGPGDMIPQMEDALGEIAVGEMTAIIETAQGFHILKRLN